MLIPQTFFLPPQNHLLPLPQIPPIKLYLITMQNIRSTKIESYFLLCPTWLFKK